VARCNCGNQTCSCIITGGEGITVTGNGTPNRPYEIEAESALLLADQLGVVDTPTLNLTIAGTGAPGSKMMLSGVATQAMTGLKDVNDPSPPTNGDVPTWVNDHWEFKPVTASSSLPVFTWGTAPLDDFGAVANSTQGQATYLDSGGNLRAQPLVIDTSVLLTNADPISKYPVGASVYALSAAQAGSGGWPVSQIGTVLTDVRADSLSAVQWYYRGSNAQATTDARWRVWSTAWGPWQRAVFTPDTPADGQVPVFRSASGGFKMETQTGGGGSSFVATELGAGDLNAIVTPGIYTQSDNAEAVVGLNYPIALAGLVEVYATPGSPAEIWQRYSVYGATSAPNLIYQRRRSSGTTWWPWVVISPQSLLCALKNTTTIDASSGTNKFTAWTTDFDPMIMYQGSGNITMPMGAQWVTLTASLAWSSTNVRRFIQIESGTGAAGGTVVARSEGVGAVTPNAYSVLNVTRSLKVTQGDSFFLAVYAQTGGTGFIQGATSPTSFSAEVHFNYYT
jgi:hypothetical protein